MLGSQNEKTQLPWSIMHRDLESCPGDSAPSQDVGLAAHSPGDVPGEDPCVRRGKVGLLYLVSPMQSHDVKRSSSSEPSSEAPRLPHCGLSFHVSVEPLKKMQRL